MKIDYIVSRIEASQDGSPYVYVTFSNPNEFKAGADKGPSFNPFGMNVAAFTSEDLMNNLPKAMSNIGKAMGGGGSPTDSPTFKISMREYEDMSIKVIFLFEDRTRKRAESCSDAVEYLRLCRRVNGLLPI